MGRPKHTDTGTMAAELEAIKSRDFEIAERMDALAGYKDLLTGDFEQLQSAARKNPELRSLDYSKVEKELGQLASERLTSATRRRELEGELKRQEEVTRKATMDAAIAEYPGLMKQFAETAVKLARLSERAEAVRASVNHSSVGNDPFEVFGLPGFRPSDLKLSGYETNVCLLIRNFVSKGWLTGAEDWLRGVNWKL